MNQVIKNILKVEAGRAALASVGPMRWSIREFQEWVSKVGMPGKSHNCLDEKCTKTIRDQQVQIRESILSLAKRVKVDQNEPWTGRKLSPIYSKPSTGK